MDLLLAYDTEYRLKLERLKEQYLTSLNTITPFIIEDVNHFINVYESSPHPKQYLQRKSNDAYQGVCELEKIITISQQQLGLVQTICLTHNMDLEVYRKLIKLGRYLHEIASIHKDYNSHTTRNNNV